MHKWSTRVASLNRMVEGSDLLPLHKPFREWTDSQMERATQPEMLALLSDATLDRMIRELDEWCGD